MTSETRPRELLRLIRPQEVRTYALAKGWRRVRGVNGEIALFDHPRVQWEQLVVPMDETFDDYDKRIFEVIQTLAGSDPFLSAHAAIPVVVVSACLSRWFQRPAL